MGLRRCAFFALFVLVARAQDEDGDGEESKEKSKRDIVAVRSDRLSRPVRCPSS